jgi:hypothetical protein
LPQVWPELGQELLTLGARQEKHAWAFDVRHAPETAPRPVIFDATVLPRHLKGNLQDTDEGIQGLLTLAQGVFTYLRDWPARPRRLIAAFWRRLQHRPGEVPKVDAVEPFQWNLRQARNDVVVDQAEVRFEMASCRCDALPFHVVVQGVANREDLANRTDGQLLPGS